MIKKIHNGHKIGQMKHKIRYTQIIGTISYLLILTTRYRQSGKPTKYQLRWFIMYDVHNVSSCIISLRFDDFIVLLKTQKKAHSEEVPNSTPGTALQRYTQSECAVQKISTNTLIIKVSL